MSPPRKACPVVIRRTTGDVEILAFRHPTAGCQLVKGTIELAEEVERAAERELFEESGLIGRASEYLGAVQVAGPDQEWHFVLCHVEGQTGLEADRQGEYYVGQPPETWTHHTSDGGGLDLAFFWRPLRQEPDESWHPIFRQALAFLGGRIKA
jgi:ADP-ribose pyrophosphatase YjhB (NUDIX family)